MAYALPHLQFVDELPLRVLALRICYLAWNISLFSDPKRRLAEIETASLATFDQSRSNSASAEASFRQNLSDLVSNKRDLFPWETAFILSVELAVYSKKDDVVTVRTHRGEERLVVESRPDPVNLPVVIEKLTNMEKRTAADLMNFIQIDPTRRVIHDVESTQLAIRYFMQRAELKSLAPMLSRWYDAQPIPSVKELLAQWSDVVTEISQATDSLLDILMEQVDVRQF